MLAIEMDARKMGKSMVKEIQSVSTEKREFLQVNMTCASITVKCSFRPLLSSKILCSESTLARVIRAFPTFLLC